MSEVKDPQSEKLPKNIDKILGTPAAFLMYLKTQLAAFAHLVAHYEDDVIITDQAETELVQDLLKLTGSLKRKPVLVRDPDATDEEIQKVFQYTRAEVAEMKSILNILDFECLREETADCYVELEAFAAEFEEKMSAVLGELVHRMTWGSREYIGDKWMNDDRLQHLVDFVERLVEDCEDADPEIAQYKKVLDYFLFSYMSDLIRGSLQYSLKDLQERKRLSITDLVVAEEVYDRMTSEDEEEYFNRYEEEKE